MQILQYDCALTLKINTNQMNQILRAIEGKHDLKQNLILKFENEDTYKLFDILEFDNFEPKQISCINIRNSQDPQIKLLFKLLKTGA